MVWCSIYEAMILYYYSAVVLYKLQILLTYNIVHDNKHEV